MSSAAPPPGQQSDGRQMVARGAGMAFAARLGAVIEVVNQPVFTRLFGLATYGLYVVLWSYVRLVSAVTELAMTSALQRYGAGAKDEELAHAVVKLAFLVTLASSLGVAAATFLAAPWLARFVNVAEADAATLPTAIRIYALTLPLWTVVEISTSAVRARRAFGPEIRVRILYEQISRLFFAVGFFLIGWRHLGLFVGHLLSLSLAAGLSVRLLLRYYDARLLLRAPLERALAQGVLGFSLLIMPTHLIQRAFTELPTALLNRLLPGVAGAEAAGLYGIARRIASILQIVRMTFDYVLAPLAALHASVNWQEVKAMYAYATRLATILILPLAAGVVLARHDIAALFGAEAVKAAPLILILTIGRCAEALTGPSTALLEVLGKRGLPLVNNLAGLGVMLVLGAALTPGLGAEGMALGVIAGVNVVAMAGLAQLHHMHHLHPFIAGYGRALAAGGVALALMLASEPFIDMLPSSLRLLGAVTIYAILAFLAARFGLAKADRAAFRRSPEARG
ncbi:MAG: oligosaccharide flippase family protein [Pseudomonadota bacterium]